MCDIRDLLTERETIDGVEIIKSIALMRGRSNGLGGGFAGIWDLSGYKDLYAFHVL